MTYLVSVLTFGAIWAVLVLSLNILVGYAGQVSLGHAAFFGIGAYTLAIATTRYDLPFLVAALAAALVTALVGAFLGLPSLRVQHDFLVLATIGLNFIVAGVFAYVEFFGGALGIVGIPAPSIAGAQLTGWWYLLLCVAVVAGVGWMSWALPRTWGGLGLLAMREDELAAESVGVSHARYKIVAFAISGAVAGIGGALYAPFVGNVFPGRFSFIESIILMSMLVFGGMGTVRGAIFGGFLLKALPEYLRFGGQLRFAIYGALLTLVILLLPDGVLGDGSPVWRSLVRGWGRLQPSPNDRTAPGPAEPASPPAPASAPASEEDRPPALVVEDVVVSFRGVRALDGASLEAHRGEVLGLIGPNGAGKTTLFNAIAGVVPVDDGRIILEGRDVTGRPTHEITRAGIGRTFQIPRPLRSFNVTTNVLAGLGGDRYPRARAFVSRFAPARDEARSIATSVGLGDRTEDPAAGLPIGLLRRLEIGRAVALGPSVILLDEPAAGLTSDEVAQLEHVVRQLAEQGRAVVLVEHNMSFAMRVCDRIVVLASGQVLAAGAPDEVRRDPRVVEVYLGSHV